MDPVAALTAARDAALSALDSDDYQCARKAALKAQAILMTIPDSQIASVSSQSWDRGSIEKFLSGLDTLENQAAVEDSGCGITSCGISFDPYYGERGDCSC